MLQVHNQQGNIPISGKKTNRRDFFMAIPPGSVNGFKGQSIHSRPGDTFGMRILREKRQIRHA